MTFGMEPRIVADICVNLLGAAGVVIVVLGTLSSNPRAPVVIRIRWALWIVAALFASRCFAWGLDSGWLIAVTQMIAVGIPVAALVVAEGMMRRHAPQVVKLFISGASLAAIVLLLIPGVPEVVSTAAVLVAVGGGLVIVGLLLALRDRSSLSEAENASIMRVIVTMCLLVPFVASDFRFLVPDGPVRMGALGSLIMLFLAFGPSGTSFRYWERALSLLLFVGIGVVFAVGYVASAPVLEPGQLVRVASVGISGLIVAALFFELMGARAERRKSADPLLLARSAREFIARLNTHEAISDVTRLGPTELAPLLHRDFEELLAARPVLRLADAPWGRLEEDHGTERARSLLSTYQATHAIVLSSKPLELMVFCVPASATNVRLESELTAAQRIGQLLFERREANA